MGASRRSPPQAELGRFAPSPTGDLHLGSLRTALAAWLRARSRRGTFLLRVEDLDPGRSRAEFVQRQLQDLARMGLDWDDRAPNQSTRAARYRECIEHLLEDDRAYPCYCTRAEVLEAASAPHGPTAEGAYPGTCAHLDGAGRRRREREGRTASLRLRAGGVRVSVEDALYGHRAVVVDDFVIQRKDGVAAYNLAVVVDDADQGVTEVVRGRDLLDSAPRQAYLAGVLGLGTPRWMHLPLVLGDDGSRLAKRHGSVTLEDRLAGGDTVAQVRAALAASLGLGTPRELALCTTEELVDRFDPARIPLEDVRATSLFPV